ncbi:hypothetical protein FOVG_18200 [Fusarium oxysporum f. sp. pisi HDV247]|uniref:lytic cellulose monooxygenase (C4-dehydrogenating) n=1 Tax=Fusarium oxysporum f. sp. pisi HDV247 TaxID=1080344 RepID=W9NI78_FUSOX|nr:hypothetical protein FOVG_18200 [Fusarium oxysporum f. sp. pisi HDV247]
MRVLRWTSRAPTLSVVGVLRLQRTTAKSQLAVLLPSSGLLTTRRSTSTAGPSLTVVLSSPTLHPVTATALQLIRHSSSGPRLPKKALSLGPPHTEGVWATDKLRENGGVNSATIPSSIAPGKYVIRNELIALHRAHLSEPEFYMQCGNIEVTGSGTDNLSGSGDVASQLYSTSDEQIFGFSVYDNRGDSWKIPGPALYKGVQAKRSKIAVKYHV